MIDLHHPQIQSSFLDKISDYNYIKKLRKSNLLIGDMAKSNGFLALLKILKPRKRKNGQYTRIHRDFSCRREKSAQAEHEPQAGNQVTHHNLQAAQHLAMPSAAFRHQERRKLVWRAHLLTMSCVERVFRFVGAGDNLYHRTPR
jgi:hypothetical protein